ncbi:hypothetical protein [Staphylococcus warneri]
MFITVETEFIKHTSFYSLKQLDIELKLFISWYNHE